MPKRYFLDEKGQSDTALDASLGYGKIRVNLHVKGYILKLISFVFFFISLPVFADYHVLRLHPGEDPKLELLKFVQAKNIKAASIVTAVGSLKTTAIRYANQKEPVKLDGMREVVALSGTLGATSGSHLHVSVSDSQGATLGGHLVEGSQVYTTLEVVLQSYPDLEFVRKVDPKTTYQELEVKALGVSK